MTSATISSRHGQVVRRQSSAVEGSMYVTMLTLDEIPEPSAAPSSHTPASSENTSFPISTTSSSSQVENSTREPDTLATRTTTTTPTTTPTTPQNDTPSTTLHPSPIEPAVLNPIQQTSDRGSQVKLITATTFVLVGSLTVLLFVIWYRHWRRWRREQPQTRCAHVEEDVHHRSWPSPLPAESARDELDSARDVGTTFDVANSKDLAIEKSERDEREVVQLLDSRLVWSGQSERHHGRAVAELP